MHSGRPVPPPDQPSGLGLKFDFGHADGGHFDGLTAQQCPVWKIQCLKSGKSAFAECDFVILHSMAINGKIPSDNEKPSKMPEVAFFGTNGGSRNSFKAGIGNKAVRTAQDPQPALGLEKTIQFGDFCKLRKFKFVGFNAQIAMIPGWLAKRAAERHPHLSEFSPPPGQARTRPGQPQDDSGTADWSGVQ